METEEQEKEPVLREKEINIEKPEIERGHHFKKDQQEKRISQFVITHLQ